MIVITGGDIELDKSSINVMAWNKEKGKEILVDSSKIEGKLVMNSVKLPGYSEEVKRLGNGQGERLLGVRLALDRSDEDEFTFREKQVKALARDIVVGPPTKEDAETVYRERAMDDLCRLLSPCNTILGRSMRFTNEALLRGDFTKNGIQPAPI